MNQPSITSILIVDTDTEVLFALASELREFGFQTFTANSVEQALAIGARESFDLLITEQKLDTGTGWQLARKLRQQKQLSQLMTLFVSVTQNAGVVLRTRHSIPEYSIRKPVLPTVLLATIKHTLLFSDKISHQASMPFPHVTFDTETANLQIPSS